MGVKWILMFWRLIGWVGVLTITRQSCLLQELTNRLQGFKIKCTSSVWSTLFTTVRARCKRPEHNFSYMLTFQIMLSPKYFLWNEIFLSTFLGLSTTDQFIYVTSIASRNLQDNIPNFQKTFPSCRGLCCRTVFVVYDNAFQQHTNADRLLHIVFFLSKYILKLFLVYRNC